MPMKKIMLAIPDEMVKVLEKERKERLLDSVPETIRVIEENLLKKGDVMTVCELAGISAAKKTSDLIHCVII